MNAREIHALDAAKTYRVSFYMPHQDAPARVEEFHGVDYGTLQVKADEWREWTYGRAVIETVDTTTETETETDTETEYVVRYGNHFSNGRTAEYVTQPWAYRPLAERDASWKLRDGWDFADVVVSSVCHKKITSD